MQYLIATYWMWFVVALFAGGVVGYALPWRRTPKGGIARLLGWGAAVFLAGLAVAVLYWLPQRAGLYLETLLLLSFWYAIGGLLAASLRAATSRAEPASAVLVGSARPESSALAARAKAAVRSVQDEAASAKAAEDESAAAAKAAEEARGAAANAAEDARVAVEAKAAEVMRAAAAAKAAKDERLANEAKAAEEARLAVAAAKAAEDARIAAEAKAAEEARLAAAAKAALDARTDAEVKAAEEARLAVATKAVGDARVAAEAKAAEDARIAAEAKAAEKARLVAAAKAVEDARIAAAAKAAEEAHAAAAAKAADDARIAAAEAHATAAAKAAEEDHVAATAARAEEGTLHPGSKPPGIAAPAEDDMDDLKLIKGVGPRNEKACHALGIYQFRQIADWTPEEAIWVGHHLAFPGRIEREHWIAQAKLLASGVHTEHSMAVKSGRLVVDDRADEPLDPQAAGIFGKSLPEPAAAVDGEGKHPGRRPYGLARAIGQADNLKRIRGIGPQNEGRLHKLGIWHFAQIAAWSDENVKWVGSYLAFSGRITREKWVAQARELAAGKDS
jgi:predicted flap endonuclease-1-like 5' DNA nuclease